MRIKLFEEFNEGNANEGMMSNIDIIAQEAESVEAFKKEVKEFLAHHAADKSIANDEKFIENLAKTFFDEDGTKKDLED